MKVFIISLGCTKNLTDTEIIAGELNKAGMEIVYDVNQADAALLNTCAFLKSARAEAEAEIKHFLKLKKTGHLKKVVVAGCLVQVKGENLLKKYPELDSIMDIYSLDKAAKAFKKPNPYLSEPILLESPLYKTRLTLQHTSYLKIADGCNNHCAYCLIPQIRGHLRSKPYDQVFQEAKDLALSGAKEISVIAQDTTRYGEDLYKKPALTELLKKLSKIKSVKWWRIMYAYPERITAELINLIKDESSICHYLDMPLQHISDDVLKRMNRISTEKSIRKVIDNLKKAMPDFSIRTNFIVGFPGETEKDFKKLLSFVKTEELDNVGVFEYSSEKGTPAAKMPEQIPDEIKHERAARLIDVQSKFLRKANKRIVGKTITALADSSAAGRTYKDAPDIDGAIIFANPQKNITGKFVKAKIIKAEGYIKTAQII